MDQFIFLCLIISAAPVLSTTSLYQSQYRQFNYTGVSLFGYDNLLANAHLVQSSSSELIVLRYCLALANRDCSLQVSYHLTSYIKMEGWKETRMHPSINLICHNYTDYLHNPSRDPDLLCLYSCRTKAQCASLVDHRNYIIYQVAVLGRQYRFIASGFIRRSPLSLRKDDIQYINNVHSTNVDSRDVIFCLNECGKMCAFNSLRESPATFRAREGCKQSLSNSSTFSCNSLKRQNYYLWTHTGATVESSLCFARCQKIETCNTTSKQFSTYTTMYYSFQYLNSSESISAIKPTAVRDTPRDIEGYTLYNFCHMLCGTDCDLTNASKLPEYINIQGCKAARAHPLYPNITCHSLNVSNNFVFHQLGRYGHSNLSVIDPICIRKCEGIDKCNVKPQAPTYQAKPNQHFYVSTQYRNYTYFYYKALPILEIPLSSVSPNDTALLEAHKKCLILCGRDCNLRDLDNINGYTNVCQVVRPHKEFPSLYCNSALTTDKDISFAINTSIYSISGQLDYNCIRQCGMLSTCLRPGVSGAAAIRISVEANIFGVNYTILIPPNLSTNFSTWTTSQAIELIDWHTITDGMRYINRCYSLCGQMCLFDPANSSLLELAEKSGCMGGNIITTKRCNAYPPLLRNMTLTTRVRQCLSECHSIAYCLLFNKTSYIQVDDALKNIILSSYYNSTLLYESLVISSNSTEAGVLAKAGCAVLCNSSCTLQPKEPMALFARRGGCEALPGCSGPELLRQHANSTPIIDIGLINASCGYLPSVSQTYRFILSHIHSVGEDIEIGSYIRDKRRSIPSRQFKQIPCIYMNGYPISCDCHYCVVKGHICKPLCEPISVNCTSVACKQHDSNSIETRPNVVYRAGKKLCNPICSNATAPLSHISLHDTCMLSTHNVSCYMHTCVSLPKCQYAVRHTEDTVYIQSYAAILLSLIAMLLFIIYFILDLYVVTVYYQVRTD